MKKYNWFWMFFKKIGLLFDSIITEVKIYKLKKSGFWPL